MILMVEPIPVYVPSLGESVHEALIVKWHKNRGDWVDRNEILLELETEKITLEIYAPVGGVIQSDRQLEEGSQVKVGDVLVFVLPQEKQVGSKDDAGSTHSPCHHDVVEPLAHHDSPSFKEEESLIYRQSLTPMRRRLAQRLKDVQQSTASLTTFNEVDLQNLITLRHLGQQAFQQRYGAKLSYIAFFVHACAALIKEFPTLNARLENQEIVFHRYCHIGIAIAIDDGLVVPVIKNAHIMSLGEIAKYIEDMTRHVRNKTLTPDDLSGGTFSITNGGVFGSLLSTPIINPMQSAILGMHTIQDRAVVVDGVIVIRPMMYLALSYDHCLIDGKQSITFLKRLKELLENPAPLSFL